MVIAIWKNLKIEQNNCDWEYRVAEDTSRETNEKIKIKGVMMVSFLEVVKSEDKLEWGE